MLQMLFVFLILGGIVGGIWYLLQRHMKAQREALEKFAASKGLKVGKSDLSSLSSPTIYGNYKGFQYSFREEKTGPDVHVHFGTRDHHHHHHSFMVIELLLPPGSCSTYNLHIYQEGFGAALEKAVGIQEVQVGDQEFDSTFMIKSNTPEKIGKIFTPELRQNLLKGKHMINMYVSGTRIFYKKRTDTIRYNIYDPQNLEYISEVLYQIAENIKKAG